MVRHARPHFKVEQSHDGAPFIVMEQRDGDALDLFRKRVTFSLPKGATLEEATEVVNYLSNKLVDVAET